MDSKGALYILAILLTFAVVSSIGTVIYHFGNSDYKTETALSTVVDDAISMNAVFVRDETVVTNSEGGVISYVVDDASKLGVNSVIANIYQTDADVDAQKKIDAIEEKIKLLKAIQNPGTSLSAQPINLTSKISDTYRDMLHERENGDISDVLSSKSDLLTLFSTYQLLTDDTANFSTTIDYLNAQVTELKTSQNPVIDTITSQTSGYFISYTDGYENKLNPDMLDSITEEQINGVSDSGAEETSGVIGKIAGGYKWYAVGVVNMNDDEKEEFVAGETVTVKFSSTSSTATAEIESVRDGNDGKKIVVISSEDFEKDFVQHRKEKIQLVKAEYEGIKVPIEDLRSKDDIDITETDESGNTYSVYDKNNPPTGVYVLDGTEAEYKLVDIIYRNEREGYVISALKDDDNYLSLYDSIITEGVGYNGG